MVIKSADIQKKCWPPMSSSWNKSPKVSSNGVWQVVHAPAAASWCLCPRQPKVLLPVATCNNNSGDKGEVLPVQSWLDFPGCIPNEEVCQATLRKIKLGMASGRRSLVLLCSLGHSEIQETGRNGPLAQSSRALLMFFHYVNPLSFFGA